MGGEDFSWYAERAPAALLRIGTSAPGFEAQLHNHNFDAGDKPLGPALRIVLRTLFAQNYCAGT